MMGTAPDWFVQQFAAVSEIERICVNAASRFSSMLPWPDLGETYDNV